MKAVVCYGETQIPSDITDRRVFLWKDFMDLGRKANLKDSVILEKMQKQEPGACCCLIYTSGTTGNPKGVMLSHDALTWNAHSYIQTTFRSKPELVGPDHRTLSYLPLSHIAGY
jgi:long-chain-fatty-acid--CoA ligase ACSBG